MGRGSCSLETLRENHTFFSLRRGIMFGCLLLCYRNPLDILRVAYWCYARDILIYIHLYNTKERINETNGKVTMKII